MGNLVNSLAKDVLIVDDDAGIRNLVAVALSRAGLTCDTAVDGLHAVEQMSERIYTVLLLDMSMPRLDGAGVLREIREFRTDGDRPIVLVMTAAVEREPLEPVAEMVQAVITKPFDIHELRELVQGCVALRNHDGGRDIQRA
jgi:DNA-binding response OmpR family regulator